MTKGMEKSTGIDEDLFKTIQKTIKLNNDSREESRTLKYKSYSPNWQKTFRIKLSIVENRLKKY